MIILSYHYSAAGAEDLDESAAGLGTFRKRTSLKIEMYIRRLDSIAAMHGLLEASAPVGVIVYSDRYRLRGHPADLDTAGQYAEKLTAYHDALKSYWTQRLRGKLGIPAGAPILPLLSRY